MTLLLIGIILDVALILGFIFVFFYNLGSIDLNDKMIFLIVLFLIFIFLESLKLTCISNIKILSGLILVFI